MVISLVIQEGNRKEGDLIIKGQKGRSLWWWNFCFLTVEVKTLPLYSVNLYRMKYRHRCTAMQQMSTRKTTEIRIKLLNCVHWNILVMILY